MIHIGLDNILVNNLICI